MKRIEKISDYLSGLKDGSILFTAWEAIGTTKTPYFHCITFRAPSGVMIGYCIDFDLIAYSEDPDNKKAETSLFKRLCCMASLYISSYRRISRRISGRKAIPFEGFEIGKVDFVICNDMMKVLDELCKRKTEEVPKFRNTKRKDIIDKRKVDFIKNEIKEMDEFFS